jgi:hypothetical protein
MFSIYDVIKIHEKKMLQNESTVTIVQKDVERIDEQMASCIHDLDQKIENLYNTFDKHSSFDVNEDSEQKVEDLSYSITKKQIEYEGTLHRLRDDLESISKSSQSLQSISTEVNVTLLRIQTKVTGIEESMLEFKTDLASLREDVNALKRVDARDDPGVSGVSGVYVENERERELSNLSNLSNGSVSDSHTDGGQSPCPSPIGVSVNGFEEPPVVDASVVDASVVDASVIDASVVDAEDASVGSVDAKETKCVIEGYVSDAKDSDCR